MRSKVADNDVKCCHNSTETTKVRISYWIEKQVEEHRTCSSVSDSWCQSWCSLVGIITGEEASLSQLTASPVLWCSWRATAGVALLEMEAYFWQCPSATHCCFSLSSSRRLQSSTRIPLVPSPVVTTLFCRVGSIIILSSFHISKLT